MYGMAGRRNIAYICYQSLIQLNAQTPPRVRIIGGNEFHEQSIVVIGELNFVAKAKVINASEGIKDEIITGMTF